MAGEERCGSCGDAVRDPSAMTAVRRIYVEFVDGAAEPAVTECDDTELWCDACTATYPHMPTAP